MKRADLTHLRSSIAVARRARDRGNHPFGAVLVDADGRVLLEVENTVNSDRDCTAHAELNLVREAFRRFDVDLLAQSTLYASTEPCVMCAGAVYWSEIGRVVYALGQQDLCRIVDPAPGRQPWSPPCRDLFARGRRAVIVEGPALQREARAVHAGFWS